MCCHSFKFQCNCVIFPNPRKTEHIKRWMANCQLLDPFLTDQFLEVPVLLSCLVLLTVSKQFTLMRSILDIVAVGTIPFIDAWGSNDISLSGWNRPLYLTASSCMHQLLHSSKSTHDCIVIEFSLANFFLHTLT